MDHCIVDTFARWIIALVYFGEDLFRLFPKYMRDGLLHY